MDPVVADGRPAMMVINAMAVVPLLLPAGVMRASARSWPCLRRAQGRDIGIAVSCSTVNGFARRRPQSLDQIEYDTERHTCFRRMTPLPDRYHCRHPNPPLLTSVSATKASAGTDCEEEHRANPFAIQELDAAAGHSPATTSSARHAPAWARPSGSASRCCNASPPRPHRPLTAPRRPSSSCPPANCACRSSGDLATGRQHDHRRRPQALGGPSTAAARTSRRSRPCAMASTSSSARPAGCSTWPSRAT